MTGIPLPTDPDGHVAAKPRGPDVRRALERDQPLCADRRAGIAPHGGGGSGIVEPLASAVIVDNHHGCGVYVGGCRYGHSQERGRKQKHG